MAKTNGTQTVETIPGRRIVLSGCNGKTNIDELKWLTKTVLEYAAPWQDKGWAYIADCSIMEPVSPAEGGELVNMTRKFVDGGCQAFAFAEGNSIMLRIQAQKNTERAHTGLPEAHFETVEEALSWLNKKVNL